MKTFVVVIEVRDKQRTITIRSVSRSSAVESARIMHGGSLISANEVLP